MDRRLVTARAEVRSTQGVAGSDSLEEYATFDRDDFRFYWEHPPTGTSIAASGAAVVVGVDQLDKSKRALHELVGVVSDDDQSGPAPLLVGGFGFDPTGRVDPRWSPFGDGMLVLPNTTTIRRDGRTWRIEADGPTPGDPVAPCRSHAGDNGSCETPVDYRENVRRALQDIADGVVDKVVVARAVDVATASDEATMLRTMRRRNPNCVTFAVGIGSSVFLGSTPELLVRVRHGRVASGALAGTARRASDPEVDADTIDRLASGGKELAEHRFVVDDIISALTDKGVVTDPTPTPTVMTLRDLHHLYTPISGHANGVSAAELALAVHPSPAVCGTPTDAALRWIRDHELLDRGWYAAPVGYVGLDGDGEFRVALRSALLRDGAARLFAGAGIVAGSDPDAELDETEVKLQPMRDAVTH